MSWNSDADGADGAGVFSGLAITRARGDQTEIGVRSVTAVTTHLPRV